MKKALILLTILGILSFSTNKENLEKANPNNEKISNVLENEKNLKPSNDENIILNKFKLAQQHLDKQEIDIAVKYLKEIIDDKNSSKDYKIEAYKILIDREQKNETIIKHFDNLILLDSKNLEFQSKQLAFYKYLKNQKKVDELYLKYTKDLSNEEKEMFDYYFAENIQEPNDKIEIYKKLLNSKNEELVLNVNYNLGLIYYFLENFNLSKEYFQKVLKMDKDNTYEYHSERFLTIIHLKEKNYEKAKEKAIKLLSLEKNLNNYILVIISSEYTKDNKLLRKTLEELKKNLNENAKLSNALIGRGLFSTDLNLSEKYFKIAFQKDKIYETIPFLANIEYIKNNKKEALKYLKEAKKHNITIPQELEEKINNLK